MNKNLWNEVTSTITANELFEYVQDYLGLINRKKDGLASQAGFETWIFEKHKVIVSLRNLKKKKGDFSLIISLIENKQLSTVEQNAIFGMFGQGIGYSLMLKRGGYEDRVTNVNVEMPSFSFDNDKDEDE